jgi:hypothetical protein
MNILKDANLKQRLIDLKARIRQSQIKAMVKVNSEMLRLYWDLGRDIDNKKNIIRQQLVDEFENHQLFQIRWKLSINLLEFPSINCPNFCPKTINQRCPV